MPDVVVCLPQSFRYGGHKSAIASWFAEGGAPGQPVPAGTLYSWSVASKPKIEPGERVYVVHRGVLLGYAPLVFVQLHLGCRRCDLVRGGGAVLVEHAGGLINSMPSFRGWRYRWWDRDDEAPYSIERLVSRFPELLALREFAAYAGAPT